MDTLPSPESLHPWELSPAEAREVQERLRDRVRIEPLDLRTVRTVAGADISYDRGSDALYAAIVMLELEGLRMLESGGITARAGFPYIPGLLSFRETPPILKAWTQLKRRPDALIVDGQGLAHPRRFGIACHLGVLLDIPAVGCAKSLLVGSCDPPGREAGEWSPLIHKEESIGACVRTRTGVSPVYVSVGHRCDLESAIPLVHRCIRASRIPETTRQAHLLVNAMRRGER